MKTVKEVSNLTGVSVRTLHYYDEIGLLKPEKLTEAGYRLYDDTALQRLQQILFFRELEFPLRDIIKILDHPQFDAAEAICQQEKMLTLKREHLDGLIRLIRDMKEKGVNQMDFQAFNRAEIDRYADEVRSRWVNTAAYQELEEKKKTSQSDDWLEAQAALNAQFLAFSGMVGKDPSCQEAQKQVASLKQTITERFYTCTDELLASLGKLYLNDGRFRSNIDQNGPGTAGFVSRAIAFYCANHR